MSTAPPPAPPQQPGPTGVMHSLWQIEERLRRIERALRRFSLFRILDQIEKLGVLIAAGLYVFTCHDRTVERHFEAWQVINSAEAGGGDGGRIDALERLNRDGVSLARVGLASAVLTRINLNGAHLSGAVLDGAVLDSSSLRRANLSNATARTATFNQSDLREAVLTAANLSGAKMVAATLDHVYASGTDFSHATLRRASLTDATLDGAKFTGADVSEADLNLATLTNADFTGATLSSVRNWRAVRAMSGARITGIKGAPPGFVEFAVSMGALPPY